MDEDLSAPEIDITFTRGDTQPFTVERTQDDGSPYDITGWTFWLTIKSDPDDPDVDAVIGPLKNTTHTDPTNGITEFTLEASDTEGLVRTYYYDVQQKRPNGRIKTLFQGAAYFERDVTRETS